MTANYAVPFVGRTGLCSFAPEGTALPTNAGSSLNVAFVDMGEISEDGLEHAFDVKTESIKNWEGKVLRQVNPETDVTFKLMFMETIEPVIELFYGQSVESQLGDYSRVLLNTPPVLPRAMVLTVYDAAEGRFKKYAISKGVVSDREPVKEISTDGTYYGCTVTCLFDESIGTAGGFGYLLFDNDLTS